ncbi:hypothetical protein FPOAC2_07405 [Fusarium poae]|uniref:hypothetical protein n=1 Tax=Fusarium poae TaxID=36050 RepID=UPI001CE8E999|nr:hypothetical protein FPOAC1_007294 [Fusarium poae]KAG8673975.1 hypothetical protein FPOAC1_007294 [Fusarium poae]
MVLKDILQSIAKAREAGEFTDFAFVCEGQTISVHKIIICTQSPVFRAACAGSFKEASSQTYNMDANSLSTVQRMVDYFYTGDYAEESKDGNSDDDTNRLSCLSIHAAMFALAHEYDINGLEALSAKKYSRILRQNQDVYSFFSSIPDIYNLTPSSSRGLRDQVLSFARGKLPKLLTDSTTKEAFDQLTDENPEFTRELLDTFLQNSSMGICYNCSDNLVPVEVLQCRCKQCGKGGAKHVA